MRNVGASIVLGERRALAAMCVLLAALPYALAQATTGSIHGRVSDPTGAIIPGAAVTVRNVDTGTSSDLRSNGSGEFTALHLQPGNYTVTVTREGFAAFELSSTRLNIDQTLQVDAQLHVGSEQTVVTTTAVAPLLQTESSETGQTFSAKQIQDLPLLGRDFLALARLAPGVQQGLGGNTLNLAVNGQNEFSNSVMIDGVEATSNRNNDTSIRPSVDAVEEFKLVSSAYAPEFGRASGGVIAIQTRGGTNAFHGTAYEFFRPSFTSALSYFSQGQPSRLQQHNFGGTVGGPIRHDKSFFFVSYEGSREKNPSSQALTVPPGTITYLPNGDVDLSRVVDAVSGNVVPIFNPYTYNGTAQPQQFPNNVIPAALVSPAGRNVLQKLYPKPTLSGLSQNFAGVQNSTTRGNNVDSRFDRTLSHRDSLSAIFHYSDNDTLNGDPYGNAIAVPGGGDADRGGDTRSRNYSVSVTETHTFSQALSNEARFGYNGSHLSQLDLLDGRPLANQFGIGNINLSDPDLAEATSGLPFFSLDSIGTAGGSTYKPLFFQDTNFQGIDSFNYTRGQHQFKFGADVRHVSARPDFGIYPTGYMEFYGGGFSLTSDPTYTYSDPGALAPYGGSDIADLLLGLPDNVFLGTKYTHPHTTTYELDFYAQDNWHIKDRLTLNYGVRYEYQNPYIEENNDASNFNPVTLQLDLAGRGGNSRALVDTNPTNFEPRLGFSFQAHPNVVWRGGYGIFYTAENDARSDLLTQSYPYLQQAIYSNNVTDVGNGIVAYSLDTGVPRVTKLVLPAANVSTIDPTTVPSSANQSFYSIQKSLKTGYSQLFNTALQTQWSRNNSVEIAYVGSLSRRLPIGQGNINRDKRLSPLLGSISDIVSVGNGNYHSLQTKAEGRSRNGVNYLVSYTWSKSIDNGVAPLATNNGRGATQGPQDVFNLGAERGPSATDVRHNLVGSMTYQLPFGKGQRFLSGGGGLADTLAGGWQLNNITSFRTGLPVNVQRISPDVDYDSLRPDQVGDSQLPSDQRTIQHWFNTSAFSVARFNPNINAGANINLPGTAHRNSVRGPHFVDTDLSLFKTFPLDRIREAMGFQLRLEVFNATNTPNFDVPVSSIDSASFGKIQGTIGNARILQIAGKIIF